MRRTDAFDAVEKALDTDQIGTVVAVRVVAQLADQPAEIEQLAVRLLDRALCWLNDTATSLAAIGQNDRHLGLLLRSSQGFTALLSSGLCLNSSPTVEVIVFGTRGVLSWEGDSGLTTTNSAPDADISAAARDASELLKASIAGGSTSKGNVEIGRSPTSYLSTKLPTPTKPPPPYGLLLVAGDYTHQPGYADALLADGRCKLIGVADQDNVSETRSQLNQQLADRLGVPLLAHLSEALKRDDVHVVSICAEPYRRGGIIVEAARAGKHLYLDKPLAGSIEDANAIVEAVRDSGVVAHMFSQMLWEPARSAKAVLESGELGELVAIHCDACFAKGNAGTADLSRPRAESEVPTRFEVADSKRELTNIGVYPMAMLFWLLRRDVRRVGAATGNFFFAEHQANDMEDFGQMLIEFEGGVTASITAGRAGWRSHPGFGLHRVSLIGAKSSVTIDAHRPRIEVWADVDPWTAPPRDPGDPMGMWAAPLDSPYKARPKESWVLPATSSWVDDAKYFLDCVEQGKQSEMSVDIAAAATETLLAAYRSAATGETMCLPLPGRGTV